MGRNVTKERQQEELEEVLLAMVEPILNFLQIHREVIFRDASIIVQNVFGKRSEPFYPRDVITPKSLRLNRASTIVSHQLWWGYTLSAIFL